MVHVVEVQHAKEQNAKGMEFLDLLGSRSTWFLPRCFLVSESKTLRSVFVYIVGAFAG